MKPDGQESEPGANWLIETGEELPDIFHGSVPSQLRLNSGCFAGRRRALARARSMAAPLAALVLVLALAGSAAAQGLDAFGYRSAIGDGGRVAVTRAPGSAEAEFALDADTVAARAASASPRR